MISLYKKLNFSQDEFIDFLIKEIKNKTIKEISQNIKCSRTHLSTLLKKYNISKEKNILKKCEITKDEFKTILIIKYYFENIKLANIAKEFNVDYKTIKYWFKKFNLILKKRGLPEGRAAFNSLYYQYKRGSLRRNNKVEFNLSKKQFEILIKQHCYYCNSNPEQIHKGSRTCKSFYTYNGIDRVDNTIGYIISNCVACCKICNSMKSNLDKKDFINHIGKIYRNANK